MLKAPKLIVILLIFSIILPARASAGNPYTIVKITSNAGLSNSAVNCIFEDHEGIIWIGTWDGLNRFNGNKIELFKPQAGKEQSISHRSEEHTSELQSLMRNSYAVSSLKK